MDMVVSLSLGRASCSKKVGAQDLDEISEVRYENIVVERFLKQVHVSVKKIG